MKKVIVLGLLLFLTGLSLNIRLNSESRAFISPNISGGNETMAPPSSSNQTYNHTRFFIYDYISPLFFTNLDGTPGRDYIALKSADGFFLGCDINGNLNLKLQNLTRDNLFVPVVDGPAEKINLRSWYGGYLGFNQSNFNCLLRKIDNSTEFTIDRNLKLDNLGLNVTDFNETLTFKFDNGYLGFWNNSLLPLPELNKSAVWLAPFKMNMVENFTGPFYFEWLILD